MTETSNTTTRSTCTVCRQPITGFASILQPGTTVWLSPRSGEGHGHLHQPKLLEVSS